MTDDNAITFHTPEPTPEHVDHHDDTKEAAPKPAKRAPKAPADRYTPYSW